MQINDVVHAIKSKLQQLFGDSYTIHTESVEQGFHEPCFFIALLEPELRQIVGRRYHKTIPFDIHYFAQSNEEAYTIADKLMDEMEFITSLHGDVLRGTKIRAKVVEGVLHFFVNYNMHVYKEKDPVPVMEELKQQFKSKERSFDDKG